MTGTFGRRMHQARTPPADLPRSARLEALQEEMRALIGGEDDAISAMANAAALLHQALSMHWTGFYRVVGDGLLLGPFQGPVACVRITKGRGVCGTAWAEERSIVVPDVDLFPGHIACSPLSRSEIVVPLRGKDGRVAAVLDIDSAEPGAFTEEDARALERMMRPLEDLL